MIIVTRQEEYIVPLRWDYPLANFDHSRYVVDRIESVQLPPCPSIIDHQSEWVAVHITGLSIWRDYIDDTLIEAVYILERLWTNLEGTAEFKEQKAKKFFLTTSPRLNAMMGVHVALNISAWAKYTSIGRCFGAHFKCFGVEDAICFLVDTGAATVCTGEDYPELLEMQVASALGAGFCPPSPIYEVDRSKIIVTIEAVLQNLSCLIDWKLCAEMLKIPKYKRR